MTRTSYNEVPSLVNYESTEQSRHLKLVFRAIGEWAERHTTAGRGTVVWKVAPRDGAGEEGKEQSGRTLDNPEPRMRTTVVARTGVPTLDGLDTF